MVRSINLTATSAVVLAVALATAGMTSAADSASTTQLVTAATGGANDGSYGGSVSAAGRYVAFVSYASNLVTGDTNGVRDAFVRDTAAGVTSRIPMPDSQPGAPSQPSQVSISADGRFVLFDSENEVLGTHALYLLDRQLGTTSQIAEDDVAGWTMSSNGRYIGLGSERETANLTRYDRVTGKTIVRRWGAFGDDVYVLAMSNDGKTAVVTNGYTSYRIWKPLTGRIRRFDRALGGGYANSPIGTSTLSSDGHYIMFQTRASNLVSGDTNRRTDVFVRNLVTHHTTRISLSNRGRQANGTSYTAGISADGRFRFFTSKATNLVHADTNQSRDLFVRDTQTHTTRICDVASDGTIGTSGMGNTWGVGLSPDGRFVTFTSPSSNLVANDTNNLVDIFLRGPSC